ncbi:hypothetical protein GALMADRAFT_384082 [Galerina marginata CBS 339.88]|uniref:Radical SAM core domain-containing protein n=1 Tax=Galerina marginata (strain CBS 339.88) TaxID=685588 RepID=A0A067TTU0_GALM3|nr:hypothetical protein GALMADRAFT_384082 [Galerina marginata CBS 339.88]
MPLPRPIFSARSNAFRSFATNSAAAVLKSSVQLRAQARIQEIDTAVPVSKHLIDTFNRRHNYLRISLTERCNLRCFYCMPSEGVELSPDGKLLTNEEILRLATLFVKSGVTKIRLTGGEPTVRKGIAEIISSLNSLRPYGLKSIGMTSNGLVLHRRLPQLIENGLTHLNLSLDTLDPFKFELITRRRGHDAVLKALEVALASSLTSVKLNVVVIKDLNDSEVLDFVEMTKNEPLSVRFIEFMPFTGNKWDKKKMVESSELLKRIQGRHPTVQRAPDELNDTARSWTIPGYKGNFGFISSMSDHFCGTCNRLRLTADGQIKVCLFDATEVSLRDKLRVGASDDQLLEIIGRSVTGKKEKHAGMEDIDVVTNRPMILIGGNLPRHVLAPSSGSVNSRYIWAPTTITKRPMFKNPSPCCYSTLSRLTHIDERGRPTMVDVGDKQPTRRTAIASGRIFIPEIAYELIMSSYPSEETDSNPTLEDRAIAKVRRKGDVLTVAQLAAIMGAKQTSSLIPLCHPLALSKIDVSLRADIPDSSCSHNGAGSNRHSILCTATVSCDGKTGVEMEALTAVSVGLLTVWDMLKAVAGKEMEIGKIMVNNKSGGRSGDFNRDNK